MENIFAKKEREKTIRGRKKKRKKKEEKKEERK